MPMSTSAVLYLCRLGCSFRAVRGLHQEVPVNVSTTAFSDGSMLVEPCAQMTRHCSEQSKPNFALTPFQALHISLHHSALPTLRVHTAHDLYRFMWIIPASLDSSSSNRFPYSMMMFLLGQMDWNPGLGAERVELDRSPLRFLMFRRSVDWGVVIASQTGHQCSRRKQVALSWKCKTGLGNSAPAVLACDLRW